MKVLIVDDEPMARARLRQLLSDIGGHTIVDEAGNGVEAVDKTQALHPDVLLMDIRMPGMDGIHAAECVSRLSNPPAVIFTTAYDQHALDAFEQNAVDYLLKPIRTDRLERALLKARRLTMHEVGDIARKVYPEPDARAHLSVYFRGNIRLIPVADIIFFRADSKYVAIRTASEEHLIEDSLVTLEKEFADRFLRIHRNAIVATSWIRGVEKAPSSGWQMAFNGTDLKLEISRRHAADVRRWMRRHRPLTH